MNKNTVDILSRRSYVWGCPICKTDTMEITKTQDWKCGDCKQIIEHDKVIELSTLPSVDFDLLIDEIKDLEFRILKAQSSYNVISGDIYCTFCHHGLDRHEPDCIRVALTNRQ